MIGLLDHSRRRANRQAGSADPPRRPPEPPLPPPLRHIRRRGERVVPGLFHLPQIKLAERGGQKDRRRGARAGRWIGGESRAILPGERPQLGQGRIERRPVGAQIIRPVKLTRHIGLPRRDLPGQTAQQAR